MITKLDNTKVSFSVHVAFVIAEGGSKGFPLEKDYTVIHFILSNNVLP